MANKKQTEISNITAKRKKSQVQGTEGVAVQKPKKNKKVNSHNLPAGR